MKLSAAPLNKLLTIKKIKASDFRPKLNELGILNGKEIKVIMKAPFSGPIAIKVNESIISIRKEDAENIDVENLIDDQK